MKTIRQDLEKLFKLYVTPTTDLTDMFAYFDAQGKVTQKNLMGAIIICLKHIEELEKDGTEESTTDSVVQSA